MFLIFQLTERQKYAKFKAADILKALQRGNTPVPGRPGEANDRVSNVENESEENLSKPPSRNSMDSNISEEDHIMAPVSKITASTSVAKSISFIGNASSNSKGFGNSISQKMDQQPDYNEIQKAMKATRHATSALMYEDVSTAINLLQSALDILYAIRPN